MFAQKMPLLLSRIKLGKKREEGKEERESGTNSSFSLFEKREERRREGNVKIFLGPTVFCSTPYRT